MFVIFVMIFTLMAGPARAGPVWRTFTVNSNLTYVMSCAALCVVCRVCVPRA